MSSDSAAFATRIDVLEGTLWLVSPARVGDVPRDAVRLEPHLAVGRLRSAAARDPFHAFTPAAFDLLARGRLLAFHAPRTAALMALRTPTEPPPPNVDPVKHWIEFVVEYPNGDPVSGVGYVLRDPDRKAESGKLPASGKLRRDGIAAGSYTLSLQSVEDATWSARRVRPGEKVQLRARVTAIPDGTAAKVRIYQELRERPSDVLETFDTKVEGGQIALEYVYDDSLPAHRERQAELPLIAEIAVGDDVWDKTPTALCVALKSVRHVEWQPARVAKGEEVSLRIDTTGFSDGTEVAIELFEHVWGAEPVSLGKLDGVKLHNGAAETTFEWSGSGEDFGAGGDALFATLRISENGIERSARSELLPLTW